MTNYRPQRVGELLRNTLATMLARDFEFPDCLVTVTEIIVNDKIERAKVFISVMPSEKSPEVIDSLKQSREKIRWGLLKKLRLRAIPKLEFLVDPGPEKAAMVEKALLDIAEEEKRTT